MIAGFDRYFQIAPCFRDEDARADRSPGEFYQLDIEMSFVEQEDVFQAVEPVLRDLFVEFGEGKPVTEVFPRIPYAEALRKYGSDKPDLRNPIEMADVTEQFRDSGFKVFAGDDRRRPQGRGAGDSRADRRQPRLLRPHELVGARRRAGRVSATSSSATTGKGRGRSPRTSGRSGPRRSASSSSSSDGDAVFFLAGGRTSSTPSPARRAEDRPRTRTSSTRTASPSAGSSTSRCSSGTRRRRRSTSPTTRSRCRTTTRRRSWRSIRTTRRRSSASRRWQYDIVCNGIELSSGAIRNHLPEIMLKAFAIAGYSADAVENKFGGMLAGVPLRRPAAWRHRARHRPHRHAALRRGEPPRGDAVPDEPARRGPADGRAVGGRRRSSSASSTSGWRCRSRRALEGRGNESAARWAAVRSGLTIAAD